MNHIFHHNNYTGAYIAFRSAPPLQVGVMASDGSQSQQAFAPVLTAMATMRDGQREQKKAAHEFLETFQKSADAWTVTIGILQSDAEAEAKLFAATTLRGKVEIHTSESSSNPTTDPIRSRTMFNRYRRPLSRPSELRYCSS
ncbi:hypothetical protein DH86_00000829 [Scytalidium sp. 3C]|nr:hypothetical protein DH86_00000829 [Scytalidium sp. 3C]